MTGKRESSLPGLLFFYAASLERIEKYVRMLYTGSKVQETSYNKITRQSVASLLVRKTEKYYEEH